MPLSKKDIKKACKGFIKLRTASHRYASFDYCYNYFNSFSNKREIASPENIEKSCLMLGFYLASWGMYRGSTKVLQRNVTNYKTLMKYIANQCSDELWLIDVNNYNGHHIDLLLTTYADIRNCLKLEGAQHLTLVTKIMLGIFGNTPAFDSQFTKSFRFHFNHTPAFRSFNYKSLHAIKVFYDNNNELIDSFREDCHTLDFQTGSKTELHYNFAKIIDMIGFGHSLTNKHLR